MRQHPNPSAILQDFTGAVTGPTEAVIEFMFGPRQHDEHMKAWRWHCRILEIDLPARAAAVEACADRIIAEALARRNGGAPPVQPVRKVPARHLMPGDVVGSGETIVGVSAGVRTPSGKVEVTLEKDGRRRLSIWGAQTLINVRRAA